MYIIQEIAGPFYDMTTTVPEVKPSPTMPVWRVVQSTSTKRFMIDPQAPGNRDWRTPAAADGYIQVGFPPEIAGFIAWMLNNGAG